MQSKSNDTVAPSITRDHLRDQYILAQALVVAIEALSDVPAPHTEVSNIADMKLMLETLFPKLGDAVLASRKARREQ